MDDSAAIRRGGACSLPFSKREEFAYSCEVYSRILEQAKRPSDRKKLLEKFQQRKHPSSTDWVDFKEVVDILEGAVNRRNGWKTILERCSAKRKLAPRDEIW